jgi:ribosome-associated protein
VTATADAVELAVAAAEAADNKLARDLVAIDVSEHLVLTDIFVIATAMNERQCKSISDSVEEAMFHRGVKPLRREGLSEARWVLLDFGDVVVHVQVAEERVYYDLERLWRDCPKVELPESIRGVPGAAPVEDDEARTGATATESGR